jgi:hypothetical protein
MSESWGQPVQIDNKPGAGAIIGTEYVVKSSPDGYSLLASESSLVSNPILYAKVPYDAFKDLAPITSLLAAGHALSVSADLPVKTLGDLLALAKAKPGQVTYASIGIGHPLHCGIRGARIRRVHLVRIARSGRNAASCHRQDQRGSSKGRDRSGVPRQEHGSPGCGADGRFPGAVRHIPEIGSR